ncbi:MAG: DUF502 domain-containing protein [Calditrichaeota bacterium]|nr:DUF502 domain-containing protein [Calditrichota bacterium]
MSNLTEPNTEPVQRSSFWRQLRADVFSGTLIIGPIVVTVFLLYKIFQLLDGILGRIISQILRDGLGLKFFGEGNLPGVGLIALFLLIILTGWAARRALGKALINTGERLITNIPLVNKIYKIFQQISFALSKGRRDLFQRAVLIEYPRKGIYSIGIVTAESVGRLQASIPNEAVPVFIISTPNPTTGFIIFVLRTELIHINMSVEEALKLVVSGGITETLETKENAPLTEEGMPTEP